MKREWLGRRLSHLRYKKKIYYSSQQRNDSSGKFLFWRISPLIEMRVIYWVLRDSRFTNATFDHLFYDFRMQHLCVDECTRIIIYTRIHYKFISATREFDYLPTKLTGYKLPNKSEFSLFSDRSLARIANLKKMLKYMKNVSFSCNMTKYVKCYVSQHFFTYWLHFFLDFFLRLLETSIWKYSLVVVWFSLKIWI